MKAFGVRMGLAPAAVPSFIASPKGVDLHDASSLKLFKQINQCFTKMVQIFFGITRKG
jgi:hypothetical protein